MNTSLMHDSFSDAVSVVVNVVTERTKKKQGVIKGKTIFPYAEYSKILWCFVSGHYDRTVPKLLFINDFISKPPPKLAHPTPQQMMIPPSLKHHGKTNLL